MAVQKENPNGKFSDVPIRVRSWGIIIVIVCIALLHPLLTSLFVVALACQGMKEYYRMMPVQVPGLQVALSLNVLLLLIFSYFDEYLLFLFSVLGYTILCLIVFSLKEPSVRRYYGALFLGIAINVIAIGHLAFILNIETVTVGEVNGVRFFFLLVILTELNDVFQYMTGKLFGKTKILPRISPNKTLEGFVGGMILTILLANLLGFFLLPIGNYVWYTVGGLLISVLGSCGDVFMSSIKRKAGVKDTGTLIPGHGGLLDRMDSLLFVAPVFYWVMIILWFVYLYFEI